jgi:hypothetical protein
LDGFLVRGRRFIHRQTASPAFTALPALPAITAF